MSTLTFPLTYFTNKTLDELVTIVLDLKSQLSKHYRNKDRLANKIASLFVEKFDCSHLLCEYNISVSEKLEKSIKQTLLYAIDTELLIRYIYNIIDGDD